MSIETHALKTTKHQLWWKQSILFSNGKYTKDFPIWKKLWSDIGNRSNNYSSRDTENESGSERKPVVDL